MRQCFANKDVSIYWLVVFQLIFYVSHVGQFYLYRKLLVGSIIYFESSQRLAKSAKYFLSIFSVHKKCYWRIDEFKGLRIHFKQLFVWSTETKKKPRKILLQNNVNYNDETRYLHSFIYLFIYFLLGRFCNGLIEFEMFLC